MKAFKFLRVVLLLGGILLSACTAAPASQSMTSAGSDKPVSEVVFTGMIESMDGSQWVVNGQTITVDSSTMQDGSFLVGDTVKVEARVAADGTVTAKSVESPSAADLAGSAISTPGPAVTETSVVFDDNSNEAVGAVEAITDTSITIGGQTYTFAPGVEIKDTILVGTLVANRGAGGQFWDFHELIREIKSSYDPETKTTELQVLEPVVEADVLLLDDLGAWKMTDWMNDSLFYILNSRYMAKRPTIITTNYQDVTREEALAADPLRRREFLVERIGQRLRSRLMQMCLVVRLSGSDHRQARQQANQVALRRS